MQYLTHAVEVMQSFDLGVLEQRHIDNMKESEL